MRSSNGLHSATHQNQIVNTPGLVHIGQREQELQQIGQRGVQLVGAGLPRPCSVILFFFLLVAVTLATTLTLFFFRLLGGRRRLLLLLLAGGCGLAALAITFALAGLEQRLFLRQPRLLLFFLVLLLLQALKAQPQL